jgi:hypothetical protein
MFGFQSCSQSGQARLHEQFCRIARKMQTPASRAYRRQSLRLWFFWGRRMPGENTCIILHLQYLDLQMPQGSWQSFAVQKWRAQIEDHQYTVCSISLRCTTTVTNTHVYRFENLPLSKCGKHVVVQATGSARLWCCRSLLQACRYGLAGGAFVASAMVVAC